MGRVHTPITVRILTFKKFKRSRCHLVHGRSVKKKNVKYRICDMGPLRDTVLF